MTWSARPNTDGGIVRPSVFAVLRLITKSNFVGCSIGRSAGLAPFRILSTKVAARRNRSEKSAAYAIRPPASAYSLCANMVGSRFFSARSVSRVATEKSMELDSTMRAPARASFIVENGRKTGQPVGFPLSKSGLKGDVLSFQVAQLAQPSPQCLPELDASGGRGASF